MYIHILKDRGQSGTDTQERSRGEVIHIYIFIISVCLHIYIYLISVCLHIYIYIYHICMSTYIYMPTYIYLHIYMYIYIWSILHIFTHKTSFSSPGSSCPASTGAPWRMPRCPRRTLGSRWRNVRGRRWRCPSSGAMPWVQPWPRSDLPEPVETPSKNGEKWWFNDERMVIWGWNMGVSRMAIQLWTVEILMGICHELIGGDGVETVQHMGKSVIHDIWMVIILRVAFLKNKK